MPFGAAKSKMLTLKPYIPALVLMVVAHSRAVMQRIKHPRRKYASDRNPVVAAQWEEYALYERLDKGVDDYYGHEYDDMVHDEVERRSRPCEKKGTDYEAPFALGMVI